MPAPNKPAHVPRSAEYSAEDNEWGLGKKVRGKQAGVWNYWAAPTGYKNCEFTYPAAGRAFPEHWKRFHPNGELAEEGRFDASGKVTEQTWWKSTAKTPEVMAYWVTAPKAAWRVTMIQGKGAGQTYRFWDRSGVELDARGRPMPSAAKTKDVKGELVALANKKAKAETAGQAIDRYVQFFDRLVALQGYSAKDSVVKHERLVFYRKPVPAAAVARAEQKLGVTLPPSYVRFVTERGLFSFGGEESRLFAPAAMLRLDEWHVQNGASAKHLTSLHGGGRGLELFQQSLGFSSGDRNLQIVAMYCFRFDSQNPKTNEALVWPFDQDEPETFAKPTRKICKTNGFDDHVSTLVDAKIAEVMEEAFGPPDVRS